ncbi:MAG: CotH kinase family protein, partial [Ignavibacteriales bacterium]|nr:CotH kinase family protein [Ignavibacteriales bacterium]
MKTCNSIMSFLLFVILISISKLFAQTIDSTNLPIVIINTNGQEIPDEPKITADMKVIFDENKTYFKLTDTCYNYIGKIGIELRGSTSMTLYPKKQYGIETRDDSGEDLNVSLLGLPSEADWILNGPYGDKSLLRNVLVYKLSNEIGRYASRSKFCEVIINDDYKGVYVLLEKIKRDKNRVNIKKLEPPDSIGYKLTGGYIFKLDKTEGSETEGWYSTYLSTPPFNKQIYYQYHYPKQEDITVQQKNYIKDFLFYFESDVFFGSINNPFVKFLDIININSFIDFVLLNEFSKNIDAYRLSTFLYKDRNDIDSLLCFGPIWDFNIAFGNCNYYEGWTTSDWQINFNNFETWEVFFPPFWYKKIFAFDFIQNKFSFRWNELRNTVIDTSKLNNYIDSVTTLYADAIDRNYQRWPTLGQWVWPNYFVGNTYQEEINYLKGWISDRIDWINNNTFTNPSFIEWASSSQVSKTIYNNFITLERNAIVLSQVNIDSIIFNSETDTMSIEDLDDSIRINLSVDGKFKFKGIGYCNNKIVEISPSYYITLAVGNDIDSYEVLPSEFKLEQNYPNPFNPSTVISYQLPVSSLVQIKVYNVLGQEIAKLVNEEKPAGTHHVELNASNLSSGIYFYRIEAGKFVETKKMV